MAQAFLAAFEDQNRLLQEQNQIALAQAQAAQAANAHAQAIIAAQAQLQAIQADLDANWVSFLAFKCDDRTKFIIRLLCS
jgi:hypothetical protein